MTHPKDLRIVDFTWNLPDDRIAKHPLNDRDASKLLVFDEGEINETCFSALATYIPSNTLLIFNKTKVVRARLHMHRNSGAAVEIFCTDSGHSHTDLVQLLQKSSPVTISAFIGNGKRWKDDELLEQRLKIGNEEVILNAARRGQSEDQFLVELSWRADHYSFAEILDAFGKIPLPPYIDREEEQQDADRYQTIFAQQKGSVAAPTAGLHFTETVLASLKEKNITTNEVTLHVGAGTFKPVKAETMKDHIMHREMIVVEEKLIHALISSLDWNIVCVGTTSLRTIESIYWFGRQLVLEPGMHREELFVSQWEPYTNTTEVPVKIALHAIADWMRENKKKELRGHTQLIIAPGYQFRIVNGLITNFHQPGSTLLLLVAAFIGEDYKKVYEFALQHDFRFLSYGDSSLLWRKKK